MEIILPKHTRFIVLILEYFDSMEVSDPITKGSVEFGGSFGFYLD